MLRVQVVVRTSQGSVASVEQLALETPIVLCEEVMFGGGELGDHAVSRSCGDSNSWRWVG